MVENAIFIKKQSDELMDMRTRIALSQIKPEFIYSTLNSVYELCDRDVFRAKEVIVHLSNYLRQNIESIDTDRLVSFEKELNHTMVYLELEKTRNPGKFEVEYHTRATFFDLPALTVQPIVENALTHGIYKLPDGEKGKIIISSEKGNGYVKITVKDNGVGFDMEKIKSESEENLVSRNLAGIQNVRNRLKIMEDAELRIKSEPGVGTSVDIIIPTKG
jgi:LytS/YehU family sensor histidine kinase